MALTRANVEQEVTNLVGPIMELVGLFGGVADGTNPFLNAAIRDGLQRMGYSIADPSGLTVADPDLAALNPLALRRLMEWTMLHILDQAEDRWWWAEMNRPQGLDIRMVNGVTIDPLAGVKSRLLSRIAQLREVVKTPYQSMNVPLAVGQITAGSSSDRTLPPSLADSIPPWLLAPDGVWFYGCSASSYWGWEGFGCP